MPSYPRPPQPGPIFFLRLRHPPSSPLFPYTTLFRSGRFRLRARSVRGYPVYRARPDLPRYTGYRSEEHTSELQSRVDLVCRLLLEKKKPANAPAPSPPSTAKATAITISLGLTGRYIS